MSFGKEAKLGVAVLFVLSVGLAVAVVWRVMHPRTVEQPTTEAAAPTPGANAPGANVGSAAASGVAASRTAASGAGTSGTSASGAGASGAAVVGGASTRSGEDKSRRATWGAAGMAQAAGSEAGREPAAPGERAGANGAQTALGQSGSPAARASARDAAEAYDPFRGRNVVGAGEAVGGAVASSSDIPQLPAPPAAQPAGSGRPLPAEAWAQSEPDRGAARVDATAGPGFPRGTGQGSVASRPGESDPRTLPAPPPPTAPPYAAGPIRTGRDNAAGGFDPRLNPGGGAAAPSNRYAADMNAARTTPRGYADDSRGYPPAPASNAYGGSRTGAEPGAYARMPRAAADDQFGTFHRPAAGLRGDGTYEIQPNDSFWTISEKCYGTGNYFKALAEHNRRRIAQEDDLKVGDLIEVPSVSDLESRYPGLCPKPGRKPGSPDAAQSVSASRSAGGRIYVTQHGDTLYDIARRELGKASRWTEIYELNRAQIGNDYNFVPPGLKLVLPDERRQPTDSMTRRPQPGEAAPAYQR